MIALVLVSLLADVLFPLLLRGPHTKYYTGPIGIGIFLVVWWLAYLAIIRYRSRRKKLSGNT